MGSLTTPIQKITFDLCDVEHAKTLLREIPYQQAIEHRLRSPVEACSKREGSLIHCYMHPFVSAVHSAFSDHRPLIISPDHIWLLIAQGFAMHVRANAEKMRHLFVEHEGKKRLTITRSDMWKGQIDAPWDEVIAAFGKQIQRNVLTDIYTLLTPQFSTTTPIEKTAFEVVLMDTVQDFFEYWVSLCGIPAITLEGSPNDWRMIQECTRQFAQYELGWWVKLLDPILTEFIQTSEGNINKTFWESFYKEKNRSGGPFITGWLVKFFPYVKNVDNTGNDEKLTYAVNRYLDYIPTGELNSFTANQAGTGFSHVPFKWDQGVVTYEMEFVAGFIGMTQDKESKALRPEIGWAVQDMDALKAFREK